MSAMHKPKSREPVVRYMNKAKVAFGVGNRVRLKPAALKLFKKTEGELFAGREILQARIAYLFPDVKGLVRVETRLGGYWTWDVDDLEIIEVGG